MGGEERIGGGASGGRRPDLTDPMLQALLGRQNFSLNGLGAQEE